MNKKSNRSKKTKHHASSAAMDFIFWVVEAGLRKTASLLGRTYNEMNVIVYYVWDHSNDLGGDVRLYFVYPLVYFRIHMLCDGCNFKLRTLHPLL